MSKPLVVNYTEKSIAIFSSEEWGKNNKEKLIELGGRYNPNLTWEGEKKKGWIFSKKRESEILFFLEDESDPLPKNDYFEIISNYIKNENDIEKLDALNKIIESHITKINNRR